MELNDLTQLKSLKSMVDYAAENFGETDFLRYKTDSGVEAKTYNQFKESCDAFSRMLEEKGFLNSHVALVGPTSFEWIVTYFGTADCGSTVIPLAPTETDAMNCKLMDFADTDVFVFDKKHIELYKQAKKNIPGIKLFISVDNASQSEDVVNMSTILDAYKGEYNGDPDSDKMCALVFTSGTTGFPKGVMLSHRNLVYSAGSVHVACPTKTMFCCLPIHHCFCFTANITKSIVRGKTVCVNDSLANIIQDLQLYKPDSIIAVPQLVKKVMYGAIKFAKSKPDLPESVAVKQFLGGNIIDIISGGAPLEAAVNDRFNKTGVLVMNGYGMTECAPIISNNAIGCFRHGSAGKPIPCMQVKICDGEILVKGPSVMLGYYKNPEATAAAFTDDGWLHTGDLGHFDDDGFLYITGRCKNLILLDNGENVSAEMLEEKFANESIVQEVICHGDNGAICAEMFLNQTYINENNVVDIDQEMIELLMRVNSSLASFQRISTYTLRDIPFERTSSAKIKRDLVGKNVKHHIVLPKTPAEKKVCTVVRELLMLKEVSITDNFFALGGDSLTALELAVSLNVRPQLIYDKPFLSLLAEAIDLEKKQQTAERSNLNSLISETKLPDVKSEPFKCALLTGATGFLGVHILKELTERSIKIYCLVRNPEKLKKQIEYYFDGLDMSNIHAVTGDIESNLLGLSQEKYDYLANEVDVVFHTAANVHHAGDYADLERTNVKGTENIIAFSKKADAVLQHTSTVSVHGAATVIQKYKKASFDENILDIGQRYIDNVYIHSKYCAEEAVLLARKQGLRANIYRIGNLTWRTSDGKFQINSADNGFLSRVHATLKLGLLNDNMDKYPTDLTAVDECARAYVNLAFTSRVNEIYHMYNPNFLKTKEMFNLLDVPYRHVSSAETIETVMANSEDRDIHVYMFYLLISARSSNVEMKNEYTVARLAETGFKWSVPDRAYLSVSPSDDCPKGHCLDFPPYSVIPMRQTGGSLTPIQKLMLGVLRDAQLDNSKVFHGDSALNELYHYIVSSNSVNPLIVAFNNAEDNDKIREFINLFTERPPIFDSISGEPTLEDTQRALKKYSKHRCDCVVAIGGGSVLDTAKIIALRAANPDDYIDDICKIDTFAQKAVPFFAVPTTSGTGSEVTVFAVITDTEENEKKPFISDKFLPVAIALDPSLTVTVPKMSTAYTGIDALSHAVEAYISLFASSFPGDREYAPSAANKIFDNLKQACEHPDDLMARDAMQQASYEAGMAFRRISTGYIHAVAHRLGEFYHIPHGEAIAAVFTCILRAYMPYSSAALSHLAVYCGFGDPESSAGDNAYRFIDEIDLLISSLGIDYSAIPFNSDDIGEIVRRAQEEVKATGYPRPFSDERLKEIILDRFLDNIK